MNSRPTTVVSLAMAAVCWVGLGALVLSYPPDTIGRIFFLSLLFLATSFSSAPLFLAVHCRLQGTPELLGSRRAAVWREAGLVGTLCALCTWLRFIRMLNWGTVLLLIAVLVLTEALLLAQK